MARRVFYSFHYRPDNWRAATIRKIGAIEGNEPVSDNDWEKVKESGDAAVKRWIAGQMNNRTCTVVLVGSNTANRAWINYEIVKSWTDGMGVVGIRIHGLKDRKGRKSKKGSNPFDYVKIRCGNSIKSLSSVVKCYNPAGRSSRERYDWITKHLANIVEEAIEIRNGC